MIDQTDVDSINKKYFEIIEKKDYTIVIRSRDTDHYWCLLEQVYNGHRFFQISHRHHATDSYHIQTCRPSVSVCCEYIRGHDAYHLERTRKKEERRMRRRANLGKKQALPG